MDVLSWVCFNCLFLRAHTCTRDGDLTLTLVDVDNPFLDPDILDSPAHGEIKAGIKSHIPTLLIPQLLWKGFIIWGKNQGLRPHTNQTQLSI